MLLLRLLLRRCLRRRLLLCLWLGRRMLLLEASDRLLPSLLVALEGGDGSIHLGETAAVSVRRCGGGGGRVRREKGQDVRPPCLRHAADGKGAAAAPSCCRGGCLQKRAADAMEPSEKRSVVVVQPGASPLCLCQRRLRLRRRAPPCAADAAAASPAITPACVLCSAG